MVPPALTPARFARMGLPQRFVVVSRTLALSLLLLIAGTAAIGHGGAARADEPDSAQPPSAAGDGAALELFENRVRPLLVEHCLECHGAKAESGLRLDARSGLLAGGDSGPAIVPGDPEASRLLQAVRHEGDLEMPPAGKLPDDAIAALTAWIRAGAPWPDDAAIQLADQAAPDAWKSHWAFQPIAMPDLPPVQNRDWVRTPVDRFVLARLEQRGLSPSPRADRRTLLRRASYDLTGLPPTAEQVEAHAVDPDPHSFDNQIERLLASPHYGQRWARHWLDVARYADTKGYVFTADRNYPNAFRYRDWVVQALNDDMPYDQFLLAQIAADRLPSDDASRLAAMGFLTVGRRFLNNPHDIIDDRIDVLTRGTMGLTVTCARCHDHKYDPIPTEDYYSLYGVLASSVEPAEPAQYMTLADADKPVEAHVFVRGNPGNRGKAVPRQFLEALSGPQREPFREGSGRLELARAIADRDNPLTARVIVNRMWQYYLGRPLVDTPSDFGVRSDPPTHPQLLDFLAASLVENGWSLKHVARLILRSATYQQASVDRTECSRVDPENRLLWRMHRKRLDFEALRDSILAASGQLDASLDGPSVELTSAPWTRRRTLYGRVNRQNLPNLFRTFDFASPDTHSPQRFETTVPQQSLFMMNSPFMRDQVRALAARAASAADDRRGRIEQLYRLALARPASERDVALGLAFLDSEPQDVPSDTSIAAAADQPATTPDDAQPANNTAAGTGDTPGGAEEQPPSAEKKESNNGPPLTAWERYVHVVLLSNEFVYVD